MNRIRIMNNTALKFVCERESATRQEDLQYDPLDGASRGRYSS
jgi:hypothetical protein